MPYLQSNSGAIPFDQTITEVLELFCNAPEQSYEQFLSTFTHLTPDNVLGGNLNIPRGHNSTSPGEMDRQDRECMDRELDAVDERISSCRGQWNQNVFSAQLEELELDGCVSAGRLSNGMTLPSHAPGKVTDNCLDHAEDEKEPLKDTTEDMCVLPGEVKEDLPVYTPSFCHYTLLDLSSVGSDHSTHTPQTATECQGETEEVVPFSLDDTFDYDNVELLHRHLSQGHNSPDLSLLKKISDLKTKIALDKATTTFSSQKEI